MDFKTWAAIGKEMHMVRIKQLSLHEPILRDLLMAGHSSNYPKKRKSSANTSFMRSKGAFGKNLTAAFPKFKFRFFLSVFAPYEWFGPFNLAKGDGKDRKFGVNPLSKYRIRGESILYAVDDGTEYPYTVTQASDATDSTIWIPFWLPTTKSEAYINDSNSGDYQPGGLHREKSGVDYHIYGNDDAFLYFDNNPVSDIDVHPQVWFNYEPQPDPDNILMHATGKVIGDQFPAVEAYIMDKKNNGVMLGVYQIDANDTPQWKLPGDNRLPMFDIDVKVMVRNGIFVGVMKNGRKVSLAEHNNYYKNLPVVTGTKKPPLKPRPATHY